MKYSRILSIFLALVVLASGSAALQAQGDFSATTVNEDIRQSDFRPDSSIFDFRFSALNPEYSEGPYTPGEEPDIWFYVETTMTEDANTDSLTRIVEFYNCYDSECNDPTKDTFIEADRQPLDITNDFTLREGQDPNWNVEYPVPDEEGFYGAVAYMYDIDTGRIVSEQPEFQFTVGNPDDPNDRNEPQPEPEPEPEVQIELSESPSFTVDDSSDTVTGSLEISNVGGEDMQESNIVEMQVRPEGQGLVDLSFVSTQDACDSDYPMNVHKEYKVDAGDSQSIELTSSVGLEDGKDYEVFFLTRTSCYPNDEVEPLGYGNDYNAGTFSFDDNDEDKDGGPNVVEESKPKLSYDNESGVIETKVFFRNKGGAMDETNIVEMQIKPKGESFSFSDTQRTCDNSEPQNVHKEFKLEAGERASTTLSTDEVNEPGEYNVYLLTRTECYPNDEVQPYGYGEQALAGTVTIQEDDEGWVDTSTGVSLPVLLLVIGGIGLIGVALYRRL